MTANKNFKRRVRNRARRTGESYTAALRHLRRIRTKEQSMQWQRVEKPTFGYAVSVPEGWEERAPDLRNSPWETARFADPADRRHSVIVFRNPLGPGLPAADMAQRAQSPLTAAGFSDFEVLDALVGDQPAVRLDCARHDAGKPTAPGQFVQVRGGITPRGSQRQLGKPPTAYLVGRVGVGDFQQTVDIFDVASLPSRAVCERLDDEREFDRGHRHGEFQHGAV